MSIAESKYKGGLDFKMKRQFETMSGPGNIPVLRYQNRTYQLLNLGLDIEMDGVTYHLSSQYADKDEMGAVIDMIEQERNQRNPV